MRRPSAALLAASVLAGSPACYPCFLFCPAASLSSGGSRPCSSSSSSSSARNVVAPYSRGRERIRLRASGSESSEGFSSSFENIAASGDDSRAGLNFLITYLTQIPSDEWKPTILSKYLPALLRGRDYERAMEARIQRAETDKERGALERVDAFLRGYLQQERRRASREKVRKALAAAAAGPAELDAAMREIEVDGVNDDLREYLTSLMEEEERKFSGSGNPPPLLVVLRLVRDRIFAETQTKNRPEVRTLAYAMQIVDAKERSDFLGGAFRTLEELDNFVLFVQEGVEFLGGGSGSPSARTNLPPEKLDLMRTVLNEAARMRRAYLYTPVDTKDLPTVVDADVT